MQSAIIVENLIHQFGERRVVDSLSFEVRPGEVFGMLGPNGAGKTTTVRLLNGLYPATGGRVSVLGMDPFTRGKEVRSCTGVLTETPAMYERLTARQNLEFFGTLHGMRGLALRQRIAELLAFFVLESRADDRVGSYSKGMKQRLALARALLNRPELLFLDEPTSGLDPEAALQVRELIQTIRQRDGHTVFLCTHHLDEAERLCDRLLILNSGRLLGMGSLAELSQRLSPGLWVEIDLWRSFYPQAALAALPGVLQLECAEKKVRVQVADLSAVPALASALIQAGAQLVRLQPRQVTLEDVYFALQNQSRYPMNWTTILTIAKKDWIEVRQNKAVWMPVLIIPLIFIILLPVAFILATANAPDMAQQLTNDPETAAMMSRLPEFITHILAQYDTQQAFIVVMLGYMFAPFFLILPLMFSTVIASESFAGERERKTIEALLYTPASDSELFLGKVLAAGLPAVLITWISFVVYVGVVNGVGYPAMGRVWFPLPSWYPMIFWISPALSLLGIAATVLISAREPTFMGAYQSSASLVVLVLALLIGQVTGVLYLSVGIGMVVGAVIFAVDAVLMKYAVRTFNHAKLLTSIV